MKKSVASCLVLVGLFSGLLSLSACDALDAFSPIAHEQDVDSRMSLTLDPALTRAEKTLLFNDLYQTTQFQIQAKSGSFFSKAFGGNQADDVIKYLDERLNYFLPESAQLGDRLTILQNSFLNQPAAANGPKTAKIYTVATNIGTVLWLEALTHLPKKLQFTIGDAHIPLDSSRVGIMQLGEGYTLKDKAGNYAFPLIVRAATLVHEARHSDCTGGLNQSDLTRIEGGELPENVSCGHLHVRCPEGHAYEGAFACDKNAWGAYSIEGLFSLALLKACANCTDEDKKVAEVSTLDSLSRVIPLEDMVAGKLGNPDMSSSNVVHPAEMQTRFRQFRDTRKLDLDNKSILLIDL